MSPHHSVNKQTNAITITTTITITDTTINDTFITITDTIILSMDNTTLPPAQPDFAVIADVFQTASNEIRKAQNLPAITGGEHILVELQQIGDRLTSLDQNVSAIHRDLTATRQDVTATHQDLTATRQDLTATRQDLLTMMTVANHNNAARVQNTYIANRSESLSPLLNPSNGALIPEFPATSADLGQMARQQVDVVLQQLGLQTANSTNLAARKRMLRAHIGLREIVQAPP
ncbi:uncharacterized protein A1O9_04880 [Exophiala aquamarina CBS 119918]|uniref:Uncharacterized protein n=1 Tax=Exophiala aquamarina CBS 119918 TaxID=1182545 RepID=A0A072PWP8_9EURO|nr:uncharacterized protein A1O9_04880 [Exophiala aquamarina CBS 119918]KEF60030.1 hypothetical protein A1O9_04880 [Exophiala aquamarina CBS 119918]